MSNFYIIDENGPYLSHDKTKRYRRLSGTQLYQYLISYRIKMAKENLITTDDPIHIIAWKSGFQSTSNFISTFKRQTGMTPKHYRDTLTQFYF